MTKLTQGSAALVASLALLGACQGEVETADTETEAETGSTATGEAAKSPLVGDTTAAEPEAEPTAEASPVPVPTVTQTVTPVPTVTQTVAPPQAQIDFGNDSSEWANDGECDDPRFTGQGMAEVLLAEDARRDATDCRELFNRGMIRLH